MPKTTKPATTIEAPATTIVAPAMQEYAAKITAGADMEGADEAIEAAMMDAGIITPGEIISEIDMRANVMYVVMPERGTTIVIQANGTHTEE